MISRFRASLVFFVLMTGFLGLFYPALVSFLGHALFPHQAAGSLITQKGVVVGSEIIGQNFTSDKYFWPRPSATPSFPYNAQASGASHLNPAHPQLRERIIEAKKKWPDSTRLPADMVTTSASGLDPDISVESAMLQAPRVAKARHLPLDQITLLIKEYKAGQIFDFLGNERVNVIKLNHILDTIAEVKP